MDFANAEPRQIEAHLRQKVLEYFGNEVEDKSNIRAANGYYSVDLKVGKCMFTFYNFRKTETGKIVKAMRELRTKK